MHVLRRISHVSMLLVTLVVSLSACQGLAGEPQIVSTLPPPINTSSNATTQQQIMVPANVDLALGAEIFAARCTDCHGVTGAGDGALVLSGQVPAIVDFNDPASIEDVTPEDYFLIITNGVLDKLMPPWRDALTEEERWAVTMYVYGLAGDAPVLADGDGESTTLTDDSSATDTTETQGTTDNEIAANTTADEATGDFNGLVVRGTVAQGTEGASLPVGQQVFLHIMGAPSEDNIFTATVTEESTFEFTDVPMSENGYLAAINYQDGYFLSDMAFADADGVLDLDIVVYESTNDPDALHINNIVYQVEASPTGVEIGQYMVVTNISDRVFVNPLPEDENAQRTSLTFALPENAVFSTTNNDPDRYILSDNGREVYDTRAIMPASQHMVQLIYRLDGEGEIALNQVNNYPLVGAVEVYAGNTAIDIQAETITTLPQQEFGSRIFNSWLVESTREQVAFTINYNPELAGAVVAGNATTTTSTTESTSPLGVLLMVVGGLTLGTAGVMYFRTHAASQQTSAEASGTDDIQNEIAYLIKQIGDLDLDYKNQTISQTVYDEKRTELKARLTELMQRKAQQQ